MSSQRDQFDLPVTAADAPAIDGYDRYVRHFLSYGPEIREIFAVADGNPESPLANAHAAAVHMAFEGREGFAAARPYRDAMRAAQAHADPRETLFCAAVEAWAQLDFARAMHALDELTTRWPADLCAVKWGQYHAFNLGRQDALLRFGERARVAHELTPYAHGMIAFALEQNHRLDEAEEEGLRAAEIAIDDAWAHHAVAHVFDARGRASEGARWLDHCAHTWAHKGVFIRIHNWWHAALFRLALGLEAEALSIFDRRLWGEWPEFPQEQIGAASFLWRLELRGVDVGARWAPIAEQARARVGERLFAFHDMHYLMALARGGEPGEAERYMEAMRERRDDLYANIAAPLGQAVLDFARERREAAGESLSQLAPRISAIGGSHAQRHLFRETLDACARPKASVGQL